MALGPTFLTLQLSGVGPINFVSPLLHCGGPKARQTNEEERDDAKCMKMKAATGFAALK
jgi:hypothetical protein